MPDPAPVAPAPVAAPAPSSTPTPPTPPSPTPPPSGDGKPNTKEMASKLFGLLTAETKPTDPAAKPKEKPDDKAPPAASPAAEKPKGTPAPDDTEIKRRKKKEPATPEGEKPPPVPRKEDLNKVPAPAAAPAPAPAAPTKTEPTDDDFEKDLLDEERVILEDARAAERYLPEKYKGHAAKVTAFMRENLKRMEAAEKGELNGEAYDEADHQEWFEKNAPRISLLDQRQINRLSVKDDLTKEIEPKIEQERHARWVDAEAPKIKAKGDDVYRKLSSSALPDEVMTTLAERTKGIAPGSPEYRAKVDEVQKEYALEFEIAQSVINVATNDIEEFQRLTTINPANGKPFAAFDAKNPTHERLVNMVTEICKEFKAEGKLLKDGKWFATREEWQAMDPSQRSGWWTFSNDELVERALGKVKPAVANLVSQEHKKLEARGFRRNIAPAAPGAPAAPTPPAGAPPAPRGAPPPAGGGSPQPSLASTLAGRLTSQPTGA